MHVFPEYDNYDTVDLQILKDEYEWTLLEGIPSTEYDEVLGRLLAIKHVLQYRGEV